MNHHELSLHKEEARRKAIDNLARYKFNNFGYWAAIWVHLNQIDGKEPNPFRALVELAQHMRQDGDDAPKTPSPMTHPANPKKKLSQNPPLGQVCIPDTKPRRKT